MKTRETRKHIVNTYTHIIKVGYCDMHYLLKDKYPRHYTCGVYGWNADVYVINLSTCIVTGYRPFGNIKIPYETVQEYELKAQEASTKEERDELINELLSQFVPNYKGIW